MRREEFFAGALALAGGPAHRRGRGADAVAVATARRFDDVELRLTCENSAQVHEPREFSAPLWEELTGVDVEIVALSHSDLYTQPIAERSARTGRFDVLDVDPTWIPDLVENDVVAPIDGYVARHGYRRSLADVHPLYRSLGTYGGRRYGFADDGDVLVLYYRKDLFSDPALRREYRRRHRRPLAVPRTWEEYQQVAEFFTDALAPHVFGTASFRKPAAPGNQFAFLLRYRASGGTLFDPATMRARIAGPVGVRTLEQLLAEDEGAVPGTSSFDAVAQWTAWLEGRVAMIVSWPPIGRFSEYAEQPHELSFLPPSSVAGKVGYAPVPGGRGEAAGGWVKALAAGSEQPEAAYLLMQWLTSPAISLQRIQLPYSLRDPYRISHFHSAASWPLWPGARDYLSNLERAANGALLDPILPGWRDYAAALDRACGEVWANGPSAIVPALRQAAADWDAITQQRGRGPQLAAYREFLKLRGSSP